MSTFSPTDRLAIRLSIAYGVDLSEVMEAIAAAGLVAPVFTPNELGFERDGATIVIHVGDTVLGSVDLSASLGTSPQDTLDPYGDRGDVLAATSDPLTPRIPPAPLA